MEPGIVELKYTGPNPKRIRKKRMRKKIQNRAQKLLAILHREMYRISGIGE